MSRLSDATSSMVRRVLVSIFALSQLQTATNLSGVSSQKKSMAWFSGACATWRRSGRCQRGWHASHCPCAPAHRGIASRGATYLACIPGDRVVMLGQLRSGLYCGHRASVRLDRTQGVWSYVPESPNAYARFLHGAPSWSSNAAEEFQRSLPLLALLYETGQWPALRTPTGCLARN